MMWNGLKMEILHFGFGNMMFTYTMNEVEITKKALVKDLGILIDSDLNFRAHTAKVVRKCQAVTITDPNCCSILLKMYVN